MLARHSRQRPVTASAPPRTQSYDLLLRIAALCAVAIALTLAPATQTVFAADDNTPANSTPASQGSYHGAMDTVYPDWFKTSFLELEEDILEAREADKRLMLVFHQPGCPYCNILVERNLAQKDIEETVKSHFDVIEINMWGDREVVNVDGGDYTEKTFAAELNVQFTPTVLVYEPDGSLALRMNGYYPPPKFRAALNYIIEEDNSELSFNEYLAGLNDLDSGSENTSMDLPRADYIGIDDFNPDETLTLPAANNTRPYILLFEQQDCSNCEQLHTDVLSVEASQELIRKFQVIRVDMWGNDAIRLRDGTNSSGRELAKNLNVHYAPTLVLYSADHREVIRSESWLKKFHTQSILDYVHSNAWQEQPSFQRYLSARADEIRETGESVDIFD